MIEREDDMTKQPSTHAQSVNNQFDPKAAAYLASPVHAAGPDLARASELVGARAASSHPFKVRNLRPLAHLPFVPSHGRNGGI